LRLVALVFARSNEREVLRKQRNPQALGTSAPTNLSLGHPILTNH
jgi:hypothetical protein